MIRKLDERAQMKESIIKSFTIFSSRSLVNLRKFSFCL